MADRRLQAAEARRITSLTNPAVKDIRGLWLGKNRRANGHFIGEGLKLVTDAVAAGWCLRWLVTTGDTANDRLTAQAAQACRDGGGEVLEVSPQVMAKMTRRDNPQTVLGVFEQKLLDVDRLAPQPGETWIALEEVRDPGNLGTIIRTADSVGAQGVLLIGQTVDPFSVEAVRATMGSLFHIPLARIDIDRFEALARDWPGAVVGTHLSATTDYRAADYRSPAMLVMGTEQAGLSDRAVEACNLTVKIPMAGQADSLNLAIATGVMLFEIRRGDLKL